MSERPHHRPALPGAGHFESLVSGDDAAARAEAADRAATLLVRGAREGVDAEVLDRVVTLAEHEGLETLAELWSASPADSLAGCLWRLYLVREWVHANPVGIAREFDLGRAVAPVAEAVAGVVEPPDPDGVRLLVDQTLRGVLTGDFADVLFRAAAFTRVVAAGRLADGEGAGGSGGVGSPSHGAPDSGERLLALADQLHHAGRLELAGALA